MEEKTSTFIATLHRKGSTSGELALTPDAIEKLLSVVTDLNDLALLQLAVSTGMRREDIIHVLTKDVDFDKGKVTYYEKKKKKIRTVKLPQTVLNTLKMLITINKREEFLFPSNYGKTIKKPTKKWKNHISSRTAYNILNKYLEKAKLPKRPFHALRATCAKLCQKKGWTVEETAKHIGDTVETTQQHYTTPSESEMDEVMEKKPLL